MSKPISTLLLACLLSILTTLTAMGQTARKFVLKNSDDGQSELTVYLPTSPTGRAVVDCPGGGYSHLSMENEGHNWASYFNEQGIAYIVLQYRMPGGDRTIPLGDATRAMLTVRDSAQVWQINPNDVGIMGFSAGGHLASAISTHADYKARPNFSILFYPVVTLGRNTHMGTKTNFLGKENLDDKKLVDEWSNDKRVRRHFSLSAIILLGNDDRAVPSVENGIAFYSAMRSCGNDCALEVYPSGGHGFGYRESYKYHEKMKSDLRAWLDQLPAPRQDALRVACIGNSITDGFGIDMAEQLGYPAQLQQLLGKGYWVKNFGVSSRTLLNKGDYPYMNELAWRDALDFQPNIVVIKLGTNDSKTENWKHGDEFQADLQQMIDSLKALPTSPDIYICSPIPAEQDRWTISDSIITNAIMPLQQACAAKNKVTFIDLHSAFKNEDGKQMQRDGIHPTQDGASQMAKIIAPYVKGEMKEATNKKTTKEKKKSKKQQKS